MNALKALRAGCTEFKTSPDLRTAVEFDGTEASVKRIIETLKVTAKVVRMPDDEGCLAISYRMNEEYKGGNKYYLLVPKGNIVYQSDSVGSNRYISATVPSTFDQWIALEEPKEKKDDA